MNERLPRGIDESTSARPVRFAGYRGVTVAGDAWGEPDAPPVILLPGGGQTRHAWGETARRLAEDGWYALSLDLRGHGDSGWAPDGDYSIEAFVGDLRAVTAMLPQAPAVVGASMGGITALVTQGETEESLFAAIVLVDIAPRMEAEGVDRIVAFMRAHLGGFDSLEEAADAIARFLPHRPRPSDLTGLAKNLRFGPDQRYRWHWDPKFMGDAERPRRPQRPERLEAAARRLRLPVLLVRGQLSEVISEAGAREFLEMVPQARFVDVSDAGHMVAGDRNDVFAQAVIDFLRTLAGPGKQGAAERRNDGA
jgi:pimeloyl-ACP methyl ester carboxylesterase